MRSQAGYENQLRSSREAKRRRTGRCADCGATTRYHGHGRGVSEFCHPCAARREGLARRGHSPLAEAAIDFLSVSRRVSELPAHLGISSGWAQVLVHRLVKYGLVERVSRGVYRRVAE